MSISGRAYSVETKEDNSKWSSTFGRQSLYHIREESTLPFWFSDSVLHVSGRFKHGEPKEFSLITFGGIAVNEFQFASEAGCRNQLLKDS
jgi:hypothetical protein